MLAALGKLDDARASFDQAIKDDPGALSYAWRAAFLLERSALPTPMDQVQADLDRSLAADASYWFSLGLAGRVHFYGKDYDAAAAESVRSMELSPINGPMRWWHAMTLRMLGGDQPAASRDAFELTWAGVQHSLRSEEIRLLLLVVPKASQADAALARVHADDRCW